MRFGLSATGLAIFGTLASCTVALEQQSTEFKSFTPISLKDPQSITFTANTLTTGLKPVQQLTCVGGNAADLYPLQNLTCTSLSPITQLGHDEIHWKCTTSLPEEFTLGETTVVCEPHIPAGVDADEDQSPSDGSFNEYVIEGSCAVEYTLHLSDIGEARLGKDLPQSPATELPSPSSKTSKLTSMLFWLMFIGTATLIAYNVFFKNSVAGGQGQARPSRTRAGRGVGGSGNDHDDNNHDDDDGAGFDGGRAGGYTDKQAWTPISPHSTLAGPSSSSARTGLSSLDRPVVTARANSSVAPPLSKSEDYGPVREVTSFGGTNTR